MHEGDEDEPEGMRREREFLAKGRRYVRLRFAAEDSLVSLTPNEAGFVASRPYGGQPFDPSRARVVKGGWNHEHCFVCMKHVYPGDEWWAMLPPDEAGLCLACHERLHCAGPS